MGLMALLSVELGCGKACSLATTSGDVLTSVARSVISMSLVMAFDMLLLQCDSRNCSGLDDSVARFTVSPRIIDKVR